MKILIFRISAIVLCCLAFVICGLVLADGGGTGGQGGLGAIPSCTYLSLAAPPIGWPLPPLAPAVTLELCQNADGNYYLTGMIQPGLPDQFGPYTVSASYSANGKCYSTNGNSCPAFGFTMPLNSGGPLPQGGAVYVAVFDSNWNIVLSDSIVQAGYVMCAD